MTYDEALDDHDPIGFATARRELEKHGCSLLDWRPVAGSELREILVSNDIDEADWIACTPAALLGWLGY